MLPPFCVAPLRAIGKGLGVPLVYNCGGYESLEAIKLLDGIVDIYLPDMKYNDDQVAEKLSQAPDYVERNRAAIKEMHRQVGDLALDDDGIALRGLIVRHLVLPEDQAGSAGVLEFLAHEVSINTAVSLMSQYFPAYRAEGLKEVSRRISREEYKEAATALMRQGLRSGFLQNKWQMLIEDDE